MRTPTSVRSVTRGNAELAETGKVYVDTASVIYSLVPPEVANLLQERVRDCLLV